jgi:UDPglucose--hexose-1-phosphate uridylyltransferase
MTGAESGPELRIDPLTGLRTIVAGARADRPGGWLEASPEPPIDPATDPFAEGNEDRTPPEVFALRPEGGEPDGPGWTVRVVPNRFPALLGDVAAVGRDASENEEESGTTAAEGRTSPAPGAPGGLPSPALVGGNPNEAAGDPLASGRGEPELFTSRPAAGAHEVIVTAPDPVRTLLALEPEAVERAMGVWRERIRAHRDAACVHVSVNEGRIAGASLPHTHAQLYALPFVPAAIARERERFTAYADRTQGRNLLEDVLQEEVRLGDRVVEVDDEAVALCPFAARGPFALQIVPRRPRARFEDDGPLGARLLHRVLGRLAAVLGASPPLNLWLRTAPRGAAHFCWHIDVVPRLAQPAGLELGTGLWLNPLPPERAAAMLREAEPTTAG